MFEKKQTTATKPKGKREIERERRAEENIITTICGNTSPGQRKVSTEWVALASGTRSVEKVQEVAKKFGLKSTEKEIDLSSKANMGKAYGEIVKRRQKELAEYLDRRVEQKKKKAANTAKKKTPAKPRTQKARTGSKRK